jgi:adenosylmethionine-8-amino-7-oxononanoate aminotransferase
MREVCDEYGVLLIFDEIMCGMGRTGYLHAWKKYNVVPDIELIWKGLAAGFAPISGMLIGHRITDVFHAGPSKGTFRHGHTFQNHPLGCAAAKAVLEILQENECALLDHVKCQGALLGKELKQSLGDHPNVGEIRGEGLFWGVSTSFFYYDQD